MDDICHIIVPHHVLNDYGPKQLVRNDFKAISHFCHIFEDFLLVFGSIDKGG
jgi:hypothetical protein